MYWSSLTPEVQQALKQVGVEHGATSASLGEFCLKAHLTDLYTYLGEASCRNFVGAAQNSSMNVTTLLKATVVELHQLGNRKNSFQKKVDHAKEQ